MNTIDIFGRLNGRAPDDADIARLHSISSAIGVTDDDNFMALLILLDFYTNLFSQAPQTVSEAVSGVCKDAQMTAEKEIRAGASTAFAALSQAASRTIEQTARDSILTANRRISALWISACALACTTILCFGMYFAYTLGTRVEAAKMQAARDWIDGPDGQSVARCTIEGWKIQSINGLTVCYPDRTAEGMRGFVMPF